MALILNVKSITWDITEDDLADNPGELPPTSFQIELSDEQIKDILEDALDDDNNGELTRLIEGKYPFCYEGAYFEINQVS